MSKRIALIIGNNNYQDKLLGRLKTPDADIHGLAAVLRDRDIGNFNVVETMIDQPAHEIRQQIGDLFNRKKPHDQLLLYFVGHGLLDQAGQLYLATVDTAHESLTETAIPVAYITGCMDRSFSRQQILILDCDYSEVLAPGSTSALGASVGTAGAFKGSGHGRIVLTATDVTQYALEEDQVVGQAEDSAFTHYFIQGLRTGAADADEDGQVGVRELYDYVHGQVMRHTDNQRPRLWTYREQDRFIIARNPNKVPAYPIKWDLIFGAVMAPTVTIVIGGEADLHTAVGMAGLLLLLYALLYWALD